MAHTKTLKQLNTNCYGIENKKVKITSDCYPISGYRRQIKVNDELVGYIPSDLMGEACYKVREIIDAPVSDGIEEIGVAITIIGDLCKAYIIEVYKEDKNEYRIEYAMNQHVIVSEKELKKLFDVDQKV